MPSPKKETPDTLRTMQVVDHIRKLIESGALQPGDKIPPEREFAQRLNISRASLRTGIGYLAAMGVMKIRHGVGTFVADGPPELGKSSFDLMGALHGFKPWQMFEARLILECHLAALAAERGKEEHHSALAEEVTEMYATFDNPAEYLIHDISFHRTIARASGNPILAAVMETVTSASTTSGAKPSSARRTSASPPNSTAKSTKPSAPANPPKPAASWKSTSAWPKRLGTPRTRPGPHEKNCPPQSPIPGPSTRRIHALCPTPHPAFTVRSMVLTTLNRAQYPQANMKATITVSKEDYLKAILEAESEGQAVQPVTLAHWLSVSPPAVTMAIKRLKRDGYVEVKKADGIVRLTSKGKKTAYKTALRHHLIERMLSEVFGMEWYQVHDEAERLEHAVSPEFEAKLIEKLGEHGTCPHGNSVLPESPARRRKQGLVPLFEASDGGAYRVTSLYERDPKLLLFLHDSGIDPQASLTVLAHNYDQTILIETRNGTITLGRLAAEKVWVKPASTSK